MSLSERHDAVSLGMIAGLMETELSNLFFVTTHAYSNFAKNPSNGTENAHAVCVAISCQFSEHACRALQRSA
ncbi:protein of unknown function (plasmid) [Caballeronia sp. S22]